MTKEQQEKLQQMKQKQFKYDIMICFWLAIHFEKILIVQFLFENYEFAKTILKNLREQGKDDLEQKHNRDEANWRKS